MDLTQAVVRELFDYNPETGVLTWRFRSRSWFKRDQDWTTWNAKFAGNAAGTLHDGYVRVGVLGRLYRAHRLIWLWVTGDWPAAQIDHDNHDRADNRWTNLFSVTNTENRRNASLSRRNISGASGVYPHGNKWRAFIRIEGKQTHLGLFDDKTDAIAARKAAEIQQGYHQNHGCAA